MRDSIGGIRYSRAFSENLIGECHADCGRYPRPVDCVGGDLVMGEHLQNDHLRRDTPSSPDVRAGGETCDTPRRQSECPLSPFSWRYVLEGPLWLQMSLPGLGGGKISGTGRSCAGSDGPGARA